MFPLKDPISKSKLTNHIWKFGFLLVRPTEE